MTDVTVKLGADTIAEIILNDLKESLECLEQDLKNRESGTGFAVFDGDQQTDIAMLKEHVKAVKLVLSYYGYKDHENL